MARVILFLMLCIVGATAVVTWFSNLPKLSTANKSMVKKGLIVVILAAILFFTFIYLLQLDNLNKGVLR